MLETETRQHTSRLPSAEPIRVCHIASGDLWAGAEVQIATLLKCLSKDKGMALSAIVLNPGRLANELECLGVECLVVSESHMGFVGILRQATRFLRGKGIHVLHSHRYKENLLAALLAWRLDVPVVIRTRHGLVEPQKGLMDLKQRLIQSVDRLTARWTVDRVIGVSAELSYRLGRDLGPEKVITIPNGVDLDKARSDLTVAEAKQRLRIPWDCHVLGTVGRLEPVKRLDIFLRAAAVLSRERAATRFVIAGEGREAANLKALATSLGIAERVLFLGHRDDIHDVLRAFDILALSSDHEGLPMVLLEAMALDVPVVARAVGGIPEVIQDGRSGVLVPSADPQALAGACRRILEDPNLARQLTAAAHRAVAEHYSADQMAHQVKQLYSSLLGIA